MSELQKIIKELSKTIVEVSESNDVLAVEPALESKDSSNESDNVILKRQEIEKLIADTSNELEDALRKKDYILCDSLNLKLEQLNSQLQALPSVQQLTNKLKELDTELALAEKEKQFKKCAELEPQISKLRFIFIFILLFLFN